MLHLTIWMAVYTLVLLSMGSLTRSCRERTWLKLALMPGVLLHALVQSVAGWLCLGCPGRVHLVRDREPHYEPASSGMPYLSGGLFLLVSSGLLFGVFACTVAILVREAVLPPNTVELPNLYPYQLVEGDVRLSLKPFVMSLHEWLGRTREHPATFAATLYGGLCLFVPAGISGKVWRRGAVVLLAVGTCVYVGAWLGVGFGLFSRGWWASFLYFPRWWRIFSLFFALSLISLLVILAVTFAVRVARALAGGFMEGLAPQPPPSSAPAKRVRKGARKVARARG